MAYLKMEYFFHMSEIILKESGSRFPSRLCLTIAIHQSDCWPFRSLLIRTPKSEKKWIGVQSYELCARQDGRVRLMLIQPPCSFPSRSSGARNRLRMAMEKQGATYSLSSSLI